LSEREASEPRIIRYNIGWVLSIVIVSLFDFLYKVYYPIRRRCLSRVRSDRWHAMKNPC